MGDKRLTTKRDFWYRQGTENLSFFSTTTNVKQIRRIHGLTLAFTVEALRPDPIDYGFGR